MNKPIPLEEQETIICFSPAQISRDATIYSCMPHIMRTIRAYAKSRPDSVKIVDDHGDYLYAVADRSCIRIAPKRKLTDEQRLAASERLANGRRAKGET